MTNQTNETSPQVYARTGGVLYLIMIILGIINELVVRGGIIVPDDVAATSANLKSNEMLTFPLKCKGRLRVFQSGDYNLIWIQSNNGLTNMYVKSLAINSSGYVFAGTGGGGVFRSVDNGSTWVEMNSGLTNTSINSLAIDSMNHIYAGTSAGIYRSSNEGFSWNQIGLSNEYVNCITFDIAGVIFAGTGNGIYRSTDGGSQWILGSMGTTNTSVSSVAIDHLGQVFVGTYSYGVFRSTDKGLTWTQSTTGLADRRVNCLAINSLGHLFAGTLAGIYCSTDNGRKWNALSKNFDSTAISVIITINPSARLLVGTFFEGVFLSTDNGSTSVQSNAGLAFTDIRSLAIDNRGRAFAGTSKGGMFRSMKH